MGGSFNSPLSLSRSVLLSPPADRPHSVLCRKCGLFHRSLLRLVEAPSSRCLQYLMLANKQATQMRKIRVRRRPSHPNSPPTTTPIHHHPAHPTHENNYSSQINYPSMAKYVAVTKRISTNVRSSLMPVVFTLLVLVSLSPCALQPRQISPRMNSQISDYFYHRTPQPQCQYCCYRKFFHGKQAEGFSRSEGERRGCVPRERKRERDSRWMDE